jgi:Leucine-rich repeat (LRR) protein
MELPTDIKKLDLSNKNLTILPDLSKFTNLKELATLL